MERVRWDRYCGVDPPTAVIFGQAKAAIEGHHEPRPMFYVGVTRYMHRRWFGGDDLPGEASHSSNWLHMHALSTHRCNVGPAEDCLILALRQAYGSERCANIRRGGGGASPEKPSLLYLCVGKLPSQH